MTSASFGKKVFVPSPPDKGSFPLDHENICKDQMTRFMMCLSRTDNDNSKCRTESRDYLACRMDNGLMARESWPRLGFKETEESKVTQAKVN